MTRRSTLLWDNVRNIVVGRAHPSTTLSVLAGRFPFPRDVERADSRLTDYKGSVATSSREYIALSSADQLNPFADYLADDAKVWSMYLDLTKSKGEELMRIWNSDLDTILIFAGLFSAILTAFLIETRKNLQQDSQVITNMLLQQVIQHLSPNSTSTKPISSNFVPSSPLVWVNGLWFVSLTFSLAGAFGTILAKGWVSQFIPVSAGLPIVDACNRHRRFFGDDQRHLRTVIVALPITLHIGFYLFFAGLVILLFQDDSRIAFVVTALVSVTMLLYLGCSVRPILNPNSPFRTPISGLLRVIPGFLLPFALIGDAAGHILFPRQRRHKARRATRTGAYTALEEFCLYLTRTRRLWTDAIFCTITSLYRLMLVSEPPSDELRTEILVNLFSLARSHDLHDPVCALAALPITPRLQETLYITDPLPALTRNITELFSSPTKLENPEVAQAYLAVLLALVQTSYSSLNWTANSLVPLLESGGILSNWDLYEGDILELIICIHIHVRVRSGFLLPADFTHRIPNVIANCTKPFHRQSLIEACLVLSVMDQGITLRRIVKDERMHPILLGPVLGTTLSQMITNPQKRVQRAVLSAISAISVHESGCAALIHQDIVGLLLNHIPGSNPQFQCEALHIFAVFLQHGSDVDDDQDHAFDQNMLRPWIESMFNLFLAAMLKREQLSVQEAAVSILSHYLHHEFPRTEFLRLDHSSALLSMLETDESSLQIAAIEALRVLISDDIARSTLNHHEFSRSIGLAIGQSTSGTAVHRYILDFLLECLSYDDLRRVVMLHVKRPLIKLFKYGSTMSEFTDKLFSLLYAISSNESTRQHLLDSDVIFFLLNTITNDHSFNHWSIEITFQTLMNILNQNSDSLNFLTEIENDGKKTLMSTDIIDTITHWMETGSPASQIRAMNILFACLRYFDLRQQLSNSRVMSLLIQRLNLGNSSVKKASLNTLLKLAEYDHIRPTVIQPSIVSSLLTIIWREWTELSEPSLMLLTSCMEHSKNPVTLLPPTTPEILRDLLNSGNNHGLAAALMIISECAKRSFLKDYSTVMKFLSTEILMKVTEIFCSTNDLIIQEKATDSLYLIINHDKLRPVIVKEVFISMILHASTNSDHSFQLTALDLLYSFSRHEETPLSKPQYLDMLLDTLRTCDYQAQILIVKIIWQIAQTDSGRDSIILGSALDRILHLGTSPDTHVSITVMRVIERLFMYDDLRQEIDVTILVQLITTILHTSNAQLHMAICHTFASFMKYRDVHHKVIHPDVIRPIHRSLYQCTSPPILNFTLRSGQRYHLSRILQIIQEADQSAFQKIFKEQFPPTTPLEGQIATEHQVLDFPDEMDSQFSEHSIIDDTDSSFMHMDRENYRVT